MRKEEINVYKFDELEDDIKERVLDRFREQNEYHFLEEYLSELLSDKLKELGIKADNLEVGYSLSYCKGDGFSFTGDFEYKDIYITSRRGNCRYYHSKSVDIEFEDTEEEEDEIKELVNRKRRDKIVDEFLEIYETLCCDLEKAGYDYIESEDSEESIKDMIEANEYEFYKNGDAF